MFHYWNMPSTFNELYNDPTIQAKYFPNEKEIKRSEKYAIEDFLDKHYKLLLEDYPILNEKGKAYGTQTLYSKLLDEVKKQYS